MKQEFVIMGRKRAWEKEYPLKSFEGTEEGAIKEADRIYKEGYDLVGVVGILERKPYVFYRIERKCKHFEFQGEFIEGVGKRMKIGNIKFICQRCGMVG